MCMKNDNEIQVIHQCNGKRNRGEGLINDNAKNHQEEDVKMF